MLKQTTPIILTASDTHLLRNQCVCTALPSMAVIRVSGDTVGTFFQGQLTQDMALLKSDQGIYSAILTPQGKPVGDAYIAKLDDNDFYLLCEASHAEAMVARLRQFALGHTLRMGVYAPAKVFGLAGPASENWLADHSLPVPASTSLATVKQGETVMMRWPGSMSGFWIMAPALDDSTDQNPLLEAAMILAGIPRFGRDWDETRHPLNANLNERSGVSFDKGCYVGQEVTSRMHWRGTSKYRLYHIDVDQPLEQELPCPIEATTKVGHLTALVQTEGEEKGTGIATLRTDIDLEGLKIEATGKTVHVRNGIGESS